MFPVLYNGSGDVPQNCPVPWCNLGLHLVARFAEPTQVHTPNGTSIGSASFALHTFVSNRQTNRHTHRETAIRR